ncbi:Hypothetical predicted protein [Mytilus galloprovincialis]|nr:Hypothetical predicted protein [Mytilus galloprovincialis]
MYIAVILITTFSSTVLCASHTDFQGFLSGTEFTTYNKKIFPKATQSDQMIVSMKYSLIAINKMDEAHGQMHLVGFIEASWTNDLLTAWAAGIDEMMIAQDNVWLPPISIHNTVETLQTLGYRSNKIRVNKDGTHTWKVGIVSKTSCKITMSHYPFDTHTCQLQFTPLGYLEDQVKLENSTSAIELTYFAENVQWWIDQTSISMSTINGASYLTFNLQISRRPGNVLINYALPVLILCILSSLSYMMPAESGERIAYSVVTFLSLVIYITMIADNIPRSSSPITIFSIYLTLMLVMSSLSMAMATLTLRVYSQEEATEIPLWLKHVTSFLKCQKGKNCCSKKKRKSKIGDSSDEWGDDEFDKEEDDESVTEEYTDWDEMQWKDVGGVLDWTFFLLFLIMTIVVAIFFYFPLAFAET